MILPLNCMFLQGYNNNPKKVQKKEKNCINKTDKKEMNNSINFIIECFKIINFMMIMKYIRIILLFIKF